MIYPNTWFVMKDVFGKHKVPVYKDLSIMKEILGLRLKARKRYKEDSIYLICGREGIGKSTLVLHGITLYKELTGQEVSIDCVTRNIDELMTQISVIGRDGCLALDEGSELSGERYNEKKARDIKNKFTVMRERAFIIFVCFTNPLKIGTYFREDRIRGVFFIKSKGNAWYYSNSDSNPHFTDILNIWYKEMKTKSIRLFTRFAPDFVMNFPVYNGEYRKVYDARKDANISTVLTSGLDFAGSVSLSEASRQLGVSPPTINEWIKQDKIKFIKVGAKKRIQLTEIERVREEHRH